MNIETKYNIGQEVWFMDDGHPTTAQVELKLVKEYGTISNKSSSNKD